MYSYKSLVAWQRASEFSEAVLEAVDDAWHARAGSVFEQLRRAAVSPDVNIIEGYALNTPALFRRHLRIAIGSAAEAERLLAIASKRGYLPAEVVRNLSLKIDAVLRALFGLIRSQKLFPKARR
jgi:four helix bundle protein